MFSAITDNLDRLFLMEFFRQTHRVNKEKSFQKKLHSLKDIIRVCDILKINKSDALSFMQLKRVEKLSASTLVHLNKQGMNFLFSNLMPKDTVNSYGKYCDDIFG